MRVIDKVIASAGPATYQLQLIHGYNRGTSLRSMIYDWYRYEPRVKRIIPGDNPGITVLVLKELYYQPALNFEQVSKRQKFILKTERMFGIIQISNMRSLF